MSSWKIFKGSLEPHEGIRDLPEPPPWRHFRTGAVAKERKLLEIQLFGSMPMRSLTAARMRCLQPRYRSVV
jgi:hypothetical protein